MTLKSIINPVQAGRLLLNLCFKLVNGNELILAIDKWINELILPLRKKAHATHR